MESFPATRWGSVIAARDGEERTRHLESLFRSYWSPVYFFIRRAWNKRDEEARDLTQEFFLRLLETDFLKGVDPGRGRFRAYVRACLKNFLLDERKHAQARKRGGGVRVFSFDGLEAPPEPAAKSPEEAFDAEWAHAVLRSALPELEQTLRALGREECWRVFQALDLGAQRPGYAELARSTGLAEQTVKSHADYARKLLRKIVLSRVREYSLTEDDARIEMLELFSGP